MNKYLEKLIKKYYCCNSSYIILDKTENYYFLVHIRKHNPITDGFKRSSRIISMHCGDIIIIKNSTPPVEITHKQGDFVKDRYMIVTKTIGWFGTNAIFSMVYNEPGIYPPEDEYDDDD
jgi:hypothetical protein